MINTSLVRGSLSQSFYFVQCHPMIDAYGDGFWLYFKRLEKGHFRWPSAALDEPTMILGPEDFSHLLGNPRMVAKLMRQEVKVGAVI